jgi:hypothetical protein
MQIVNRLIGPTHLDHPKNRELWSAMGYFQCVCDGATKHSFKNSKTRCGKGRLSEI